MLLGGGGGDNITLSVATNITPANAAVAISPTGTGTVTINPATASTINNTSIGATTALSGRFTDVTLTTGNVIVANGQGIDFSATPGTGTSELLDDYEEGTWTPLLTCTDGNFTSVTYDALRGGSYSKVGNMVHVQCYMRTDAVDNTVGRTGDVLISGLPFTAISGTGGTLNGHCSLAVSVASTWAGDEPIGAFISGGDNSIQLMSRLLVNGNTSNITATAVGTGANANIVLIGGTYLAA